MFRLCVGREHQQNASELNNQPTGENELAMRFSLTVHCTNECGSGMFRAKMSAFAHIHGN